MYAKIAGQAYQKRELHCSKAVAHIDHCLDSTKSTGGLCSVAYSTNLDVKLRSSVQSLDAVNCSGWNLNLALHRDYFLLTRVLSCCLYAAHNGFCTRCPALLHTQETYSRAYQQSTCMFGTHCEQALYDIWFLSPVDTVSVVPALKPN